MYHFLLILLLTGSGTEALFAQQDTAKIRYPVRKTMTETPEDLDRKPPADLKTPSNIKTETVYDYKTNRYIFRNKIGDAVVGVPFTMSPEEYMKYRLKQLNATYFKNKNAVRKEEAPPPQDKVFSLLNIRKSNSILEDIFGPGGVQITTQGSIELSAGLKRNVIDNPTLPQRARKRNRFDFDRQIQLNVNAKVGNKINFGLNYNTDAMFDFDAKRIKLAYQGDEDEIIKNVEAGNVSMTTENSLIDGGAALFGIKSDLQFGKLRVNAMISRQESESRTAGSRGGVQTTPFEITADHYEENRHFFLSHYFRENYDKALAKLPYVQSAISITRIEVWITNKKSNYNQARNILAFADLAEHSAIHNPLWLPAGTETVPHNRANTLYEQLVTVYSAARDISRTAQTFPADLVIGQDYEKIENARLLNPSEYLFQPQLGYLSLRTPLQDDEALAVAFEYTHNGKAYQVGEFSGDVGREEGNATTHPVGALFLKLLKPVSLSPQSYTWHLMMKNIYALGYGAYNIQKDRFKLEISYQSDTTGVYLNYIPEGNIRNRLLLRVMNLDNLNSKNDPYPDGVFDFIEGYTVSVQNGSIIFPVIEPFGSHLRKAIGDNAIADKYVYRELYDSTLTVARQTAEKNKFRISGEYRGNSSSEINLNATNVARGSVRVTAGGITLTEGVDYTVDYVSGTVNIINQTLLDAGTPVNVSLESRSLSSMHRKTRMGLNLAYDFSKDFTLGATVMHLYEKPLTTKTVFGEESVRNTLWGVNTLFRKQSYALTNLIDMLPFTDATAPSQLTANIEFAQMIPDHYKDKYTGGYSYLDDFETSTSGIDLRSPYNWSLASVPLNNTSSGLFPEAALSNNIDYGKNRAQIAWFYIDRLFTRRNSSLTPAHIKNDKEQLSSHLVREIYEREIFPDKQAVYGEPTTLPVLNISFYPDERGPYNLDTDIGLEGKLLHPQKRWGGITRRMDTRDFEAANIEYIDFWLMDPFVEESSGSSRGGDLYFNLGHVSEDVLKDGKKFFENGLPVNGDETATGLSVWGKYPLRQSTVYAFDNSSGNQSRRIQDVGLNGLSSEEEKVFPSYSTYLNRISAKLSAGALSRMQADKHSPLNDPSGDNFRHYRGDEQDRARLSILDRYKYYNGTEGNSLAPEEAQSYSTASRATPDTEDADNDNTLNENESYYQYKVQLRPEKMVEGSNYIVDKREVSVSLRNGETGKVNWYRFKIPIRSFQSKTGTIQGFNNIRFMRMFLTGFERPVFLRFATLELVRSEWRSYTQDLRSGGAAPGLGKLGISTVNIEENSDRTPVNYVLPPGVNRILDPSQPQLREQNEQAIALKIDNLDPGDARAIYKNTMFDLRRYKRLQMFVHAEKPTNSATDLQDGEISIFLRIGSDYRNNFYEYEIPLRLTPPGRYSTHSPAHQETVWRPENMFDFPLRLLTDLKLKRNAEKRRGSGVTYLTPYSETDPEKPENRLTIIGNPSLSEAKVLMIGVRNNSNGNKSAEVWINELRLSEFDERGGWAAQGNVNLALSDIGTINVSGRKETTGFGALDQNLMQRRNDDYSSVNITVNMELGRFLPSQTKISAPLYYSFSNQTTTPEYDPLDKDIRLSESLKNSRNEQERDSVINLAVIRTVSKSLSLSNVKSDIKSKIPMPYDPSNFDFTYSYSENRYQNPETQYNNSTHRRLQVNYAYTPLVKPFEPFKNLKSNSGWLKLIRSFNLNYLPNNIRIGSNLMRDYQETQLRDLNAYLSGITQAQRHYLTFSRNFTWNRDFSIDWDLTRNLKTSFRSGTIAEIEEPHLQVNKKLNRDDYEIWRDSVVQSIKNLGKPLNYEQTADATYTLPFAEIPILDWIASNVVYNSRYRWERGAFVPGANIGNFVQNEMSVTVNGRFDLVRFYDKFNFLKKTNRRFDATTSANTQKSSSPNSLLEEIAQYSARMLMTVRSVNLNFGYKSRTDIPGFDRTIGDFFGQSDSPAGLIPGLGFAFGFEGGERFLEKADANNWLVKNHDNISPAVYNRTRNLRMDATLEPFKGLKIELNALYEDNRRTEIRYMFDGMPRLYGGTFAMSAVLLTSAFESSTPQNNYASKSFERFRQNRTITAKRLHAKYRNTIYPNRGFIAETPFHGHPFDPANGDVNPNSPDALIPAFLAAYTGQNPAKVQLTAFPRLWTLLPNWDVSYNLLQMLPTLQNNFKSLTLMHKYVSQYRVGMYSSYLNWVASDDNSDLGFVRDALTGSPIPSAPYDIPAVSLIESFSPLIETRAVLHNNASVNFRINRTRSLNLNVSSYQIVETNDNDVVFGVGYRLADFNRIVGFGSNSIRTHKRRTRTNRTEQAATAASDLPEFNNDLNIRIDISHKTTQALIRQIESGFTQATSGLKTTTIRFSADYALSRSLTFRAFFDKLIHTPLVSASAYPTANTNAGMSLRLNLNR